MSRGRFGVHGGQYMSETLMNELLNLEEQYNHFKEDPEFVEELNTLLKEYAGRPSLLYYAKRMTEDLGGAKIYLKREDLNHTGAHKINNVLGQCLLAKKMGKTRVIAETGAGQHGVATATAAALLGMECEVFMGEEDTRRQALNVFRMELLGAKVHTVTTGSKVLKDAVNDAFREWISRVDDTHYVIGSTMGPHPFPTIVRDFQAVISEEIKEQIMELEGKLPDMVIACVGGGSNAMGAFYNFLEDEEVKLVGVEAAGKGIDTEFHAATIAKGELGIFHGMKSYFCQGNYGQISPVYSISAGLDYPGIGPEHAYLHDIGRAEYVSATDDEAVEAFEYLSRMEGIIPAIESSHAIAHAMRIAGDMDKNDIIVINVSGRGDKDVAAMSDKKDIKIADAFKDGKAFIGFLTAGDPTIEKTVEYVLAMEEAGCDLVEIGIPFSDPVAEGPVIQEANIRALSNNTNTDDVFEAIRQIREKSDVPLVFLTYINPVFYYGYDKFFKRCQELNVCGIISPDLPYDEKDEILEVTQKYGIDIISLIAPTSKERIQMIAREANGFIYVVSSLGVTGMRSEIRTDLESILNDIKEVTDVPAAVGFGINTPEQAENIAKVADGIIVGSAIVNIIAEHGENAKEPLVKYVQSMKDAIS